MSTWTVLKDLVKKNCQIRNVLTAVKDGIAGDNGEKLDGHISDEDYLMRNKIWNKFSMINMGDYHDHYLKKRCFVISSCF